ncbi:MAG TPA: metalloenzyme [Nitrospiria bacterium]|nr:metalloenzyme [Nitrospiria bacterium]
MNHLVYLIIDSARYDSFEAAAVPNMRSLGRAERRYSYAGWTSPSHFVYLMGMTPHRSPSGVFASEVYKKDYLTWGERLGITGLAMKDFVPQFWLPRFLKSRGYATHARVSMPIINPMTLLNSSFDSYKLMERYNDFEAMINDISFGSSPCFYFLNLGEAHYPYGIPPAEMPPLHGEHGVFKRSGDDPLGHRPDTPDLAGYYFEKKHLDLFRARQIAAIEHVDRLMERLFKKCPAGTHVMITADHGELFGEEGYFGHGPIMHEKVFEVPYIEGRL